MNPDNCLPFSLSSPSHSSLPPELHSSQNHHFSLGLVNEAMENHFHNQEWNLIHTHGGGGGDHVPKVADFLGVSNKSDSHSRDLVLYNGIQPIETNYLFQSNNLMAPVQNSLGVMRNDCYDLQENANNLQALTLSMGSGKGSSSPSCETARPVDNSSTNANNAIVEANPRRNLDTFGQRTSIYRGVTRHRWTGRYEAHLWDNSCRREGQSRKGRQVYLGGYDKEEKAARSYDLAALKYWGTSTTTNFPISNYEKEIEEMKQMTRQEFVASIRRKSSGFSRGASMYRGVTRHHQHGRWQARIGRVAGNKDLYLGTFGTEEEAAEAYDVAAIKFRGLNAVTNFDMNRYDVKSILESNTLPIGGGAAKRLKEAQAMESSLKRDEILGLQGPTNFHYVGSSMNVPIQAYPLNVHHHSFDQNQTLLALQNHQDLTHHFSSPQDSNSYQSYIQTQLQLQQQQQQQHQQQSVSYHSNLYDNYLHGTHGMLGDDTISAAMETDSSGGSYCGGGYLGNELGIGLGPGSSGGNTNGQGLGLTKVDYDVRPGSSTYGGWSTEESGQGSGAGFFSMWNDG